MNKILTLLTFIIGTTLSALAQNPIKMGERQFNAGLGIFGKGTAMYAGMDFGIVENISAGGEIAFHSKTSRFGFGKISYQGFGLGANANYHFNELLNLQEQWGLYAGLTLSYFKWNTNVTDSSGNPYTYIGTYDYDSGLKLDFQVGGRYFFNERFGLNLELGGLSESGGKLGITYKF